METHKPPREEQATYYLLHSSYIKISVFYCCKWSHSPYFAYYVSGSVTGVFFSVLSAALKTVKHPAQGLKGRLGLASAWLHKAVSFKQLSEMAHLAESYLEYYGELVCQGDPRTDT